MRKILLLSLVIVFTLSKSNAQSELNPIITATPFLQIAPDAKSGGMGNVGVSTMNDINSQYWNASKYVFMENSIQVGIFHTPWLRDVVNDVFLGGLSFANKLDERSAWAVGLRYFNLGNIELTDSYGTPIGTEKVNEFSIDGSYSLKLSKEYAMGVTLRYIRSDLGIKSVNSAMRAVNTISADISGIYIAPKQNYEKFDGIWRFGFNVSNLGPRVSYTNDSSKKNYLPTNMRVGGSFDFIFNEQNTLSCNLDINKLLVPTPNISVNKDNSAPYMQSNKGFIEGIFSSFGDAPGGIKEELREFSWGIGLEYTLNKMIAFRTGYFHENKTKGTHQFFTLGTGLEYKNFGLDVSYLFNTSDIANPIGNTLRFSLSYAFGKPIESSLSIR